MLEGSQGWAWTLLLGIQGRKDTIEGPHKALHRLGILVFGMVLGTKN